MRVTKAYVTGVFGDQVHFGRTGAHLQLNPNRNVEDRPVPTTRSADTNDRALAVGQVRVVYE